MSQLRTSPESFRKTLLKGMSVPGLSFLFLGIVLVGVVLLSQYSVSNKNLSLQMDTLDVAPDDAKTEKKFVYQPAPRKFAGEAIQLPAPKQKGAVSLEEAITKRETRRIFDPRPVALAELSQVLWAAYGFSDIEKGFRSVPSARTAFPYDFMFVARNVTGLEPGLYLYLPESHMVQPMLYDEHLIQGEGYQDPIKQAPVVFVFGAINDKMREKSQNAETAPKATLQESGHISQNIYLMAEVTGMATGAVAGFNEKALAQELNLPSDVTVVYLQTFGVRSSDPEPAH